MYLLWDTFSPPFFVGGLIILICNNVLFILFLLDLHMNSLYRNGISLISALRLLFWALNYIENGKNKNRMASLAGYDFCQQGSTFTLLYEGKYTKITFEIFDSITSFYGFPILTLL